jgi:26S proteasome regulatory subunit N6
MAERGQHLTKKIEEATSYEDNRMFGEAIKAYLEIIKAHL